MIDDNKTMREDLQRGHVVWWWSSHLSKQFLWNIWQQLHNSLICSSASNELKQTEHISLSPVGSENLRKNCQNVTAGKLSLIYQQRPKEGKKSWCYVNPASQSYRCHVLQSLAVKENEEPNRLQSLYKKTWKLSETEVWRYLDRSSLQKIPWQKKLEENPPL